MKQYEAGEFTVALKGFETFLKHQPSYPYARSYAAKCRQMIKQGGKPKAKIDAKLAGIIIPSIDFNGTDLGLVFEFLSQKSEELSEGKVVANFIYKGSEEMKKNNTVTLKLRNAPFLDVVRYVGQLTRTNFDFEEFAIVGTPVGSGAPSPTPGTGTQTTSLESKFDSASKLTPIPPANKDPFANR